MFNIDAKYCSAYIDPKDGTVYVQYSNEEIIKKIAQLSFLEQNLIYARYFESCGIFVGSGILRLDGYEIIYSAVGSKLIKKINKESSTIFASNYVVSPISPTELDSPQYKK